MYSKHNSGPSANHSVWKHFIYET